MFILVSDDALLPAPPDFGNSLWYLLLLNISPYIAVAMVFVGLVAIGLTGRISAGIQVIAAGITFPIMLHILPSLMETVESESPKPSPKPGSSPLGFVDWSTVLVVVGVIAALVVSVIVGFVVTDRVHARRASKLKRKQEQEEQERINTALNRREVQGLDYAERNGHVTDHDLKALTPGQLQKKVDAANMHSAEIFDVLQTLPYYEGDKLSKRDRRRRNQLLSDLKVMREQPEEVQRKALSGHTDQLIGRVRAAVQSVRDLPEG